MTDKPASTDAEGVIKYQLTHIPGPLPSGIDIRPLDAWRGLLHQLGLIGQRADRYGGLGYGNISVRLAPNRDEFLISGTQTGHLSHLQPADFSHVICADPSLNQLKACGPSLPSSEALTHASVYTVSCQTQAVIHVHSPIIWQQTLPLNLAHTCADIDYGSVAMATAVTDLFSSGRFTERKAFSMLGHLDGIVTFGDSLADAAQTLLQLLVDASMVEQT